MSARPDDDLERLTTLVARLLAIDASQVVAEARFVQNLGADSLDAVELVMPIEEAFDVEIPVADAARLLTVGDALAHVRSPGAAARDAYQRGEAHHCF